MPFAYGGKTSQNVHTHTDMYTNTHQPSHSDEERCMHYNEIMSANSLKEYLYIKDFAAACLAAWLPAKEIALQLGF